MVESRDLDINARLRFAVQSVDSPDAPGWPTAVVARIERAFARSQGVGLVHLATTEATTALLPELAFAREFAQRYVTRLCHPGDAGPDAPDVLVALLGEAELEALRLAAPLIRGWCAPRAFRPTTA